MNGEMNHPYEFLNSRNPSLHTIFVPRFAVRSITFVLSLVFIALFASLLIYSYTRPQSDLTWNCSLYQLQNKYFPRLRYNY